MRIKKVISGGQTGADQAGWWAARDCGIDTGGHMPNGFRTEDGDNPFIGRLFDADELMGQYSSERDRTETNVEMSDGTVWFGDAESPGGRCTRRAAIHKNKPLFRVEKGLTTPREVAEWIETNRIETLNVAGNRASSAPDGFGEQVRVFLVRVFRITNPQMST